MATAPKWWDCTVPRNDYTVQELQQLLEQQAERYVIGIEVGKTGYEHYQIRMVLHEAQTLKKINKWLSGHKTPTKVRNFQYCEKEGNFIRSWEKVLSKYVDVKLRAWQECVLSFFKQQDDRKVLVVYNESGNIGKTYLAKHIHATHQGQYVPQLDSALDYMAFAMEKQANGYIIDVPRSENIKTTKAIWSAIEQIKNGYVYDKRYSYRDCWTESPKIVVFTNDIPPISALSQDRWEFVIVSEHGGYNITPYSAQAFLKNVLTHESDSATA